MVYEQPETEAAMLEVIRALREHPEKYEAVQKALSDAQSDEERVSTLLEFATSEQELAALMPSRVGGEETQLAWTTVTVTTVFIPSSAY